MAEQDGIFGGEGYWAVEFGDGLRGQRLSYFATG
jgi:hypothetical protein